MSAAATDSRRGLSLVKGPVAIVGVLGIAMGVLGLIFGGHSFSTASIPHGAVHGKAWLGISLNGWTNLLFIAAGLLLLLGSSMHWGAKTAAFIVAGVLGAAAVIGVIRGNGVFGIFAANHRTEIVWGAAAIVLVLLSMLPRVGGRARRGRKRAAVDEPARYDEPATGGRARTTPGPAAVDEPARYDEPATGGTARTTREPAAVDEPARYDERTTDEPARRTREPGTADHPSPSASTSTGTGTADHPSASASTSTATEGTARTTREPRGYDEPDTSTAAGRGEGHGSGEELGPGEDPVTGD